MNITWLGHDAFLFETAKGVKVLSDPYVAGSYDGAVGYKPITEVVDVVFVSHASHPDHAGHKNLPGAPEVVLGAGRHEAKGITFKGVATFHDKSGGKERGHNTVFVMEADELRICHCGDLGHTLAPAQVQEIGAVDILFVPVGGFFTIDHREAWEVVEALKPKIVVPMHYKTDVLGFPLDKVDEFLKGKRNVERIKGSSFEVSKETLPKERKIVVIEEHLL
ncbi:MAG: MBL fold metallo-hydrolase [bacterium]|jgi:L-ascorbate metabolism protein UlaG (beta-lactamase superfamily)|nr:MBL fold metallo-hydrolase [candidate division KSB1 bacterium]MDH7560163.1 MBL fold metallo-hydrolase [bacterium]